MSQEETTRQPRTHMRRRSDRARWWANAGVATAFLFIGGRWTADYLTREQTIRAKMSEVQALQTAESIKRIETLSGDVRVLSSDVRTLSSELRDLTAHLSARQGRQ